MELAEQVSIPFKRESVSELDGQDWVNATRKEFQFPSNGKAYLNSINPKEKNMRSTLSFNSLQTGKRI